MKRKTEMKPGRDWLPLRIDGCEVSVFFPSAYEDEKPGPAKLTDLERMLLANYKISSHNEKNQ